MVRKIKNFCLINSISVIVLFGCNDAIEKMKFQNSIESLDYSTNDGLLEDSLQLLDFESVFGTPIDSILIFHSFTPISIVNAAIHKNTNSDDSYFSDELQIEEDYQRIVLMANDKCVSQFDCSVFQYIFKNADTCTIVGVFDKRPYTDEVLIYRKSKFLVSRKKKIVEDGYGFILK